MTINRGVEAHYKSKFWRIRCFPIRMRINVLVYIPQASFYFILQLAQCEFLLIQRANIFSDALYGSLCECLTAREGKNHGSCMMLDREYLGCFRLCFASPSRVSAQQYP